MANLEKYTNIYADLAQGAYIGRKEGFMFAKLTQVQKEELKLNEHATFHFPNAKDAHGNDASTAVSYTHLDVLNIRELNNP
ncbi:hypothetical protein A5797_002670 [Enterococcus faecalis]|uniref:hypothetical protein n=1 Tax=Enterococcus faecalis TaxID=1351 RepID=UPI000A358830|nr:hypothetical protein [Enterococcus faecalis]OTP36083.1 hypothetical protein A5797_002670 [Enterococcus faecalis]